MASTKDNYAARIRRETPHGLYPLLTGVSGKVGRPAASPAGIIQLVLQGKKQDIGCVRTHQWQRCVMVRRLKGRIAQERLGLTSFAQFHLSYRPGPLGQAALVLVEVAPEQEVVDVRKEVSLQRLGRTSVPPKVALLLSLSSRNVVLGRAPNPVFGTVGLPGARAQSLVIQRHRWLEEPDREGERSKRLQNMVVRLARVTPRKRELVRVQSVQKVIIS